MGFATEPPFCTAYLLTFANRDDPSQMTFRHPHNHPCYFTVEVLLIRQLLAQDCTQHEYEEDRRRRHVLIPRGIHFSEDLFPQITVPQAHAVPFPNPLTGIVPSSIDMGPFASMDKLFTGTAGDLDLFTDMEISGLVHVGLLEPSVAGRHDTPAAPVGSVLSSGGQGPRDSPSHGCHRRISVAAGSQDELDRPGHEREVAHKWLHQDIRAEPGQSISREVSHGLKHGGTDDIGLSMECPCPKECRSERGRSRKHKCLRMPECTLPHPFLLPPMAPSRAAMGSVSVPSVDVNRRPPSLDKHVRTGASVPVGLVPLYSMHQEVQGIEQLNMPMGSTPVTARLTTA